MVEVPGGAAGAVGTVLVVGEHSPMLARISRTPSRHGRAARAQRLLRAAIFSPITIPVAARRQAHAAAEQNR